jgi:acylphosphatase
VTSSDGRVRRRVTISGRVQGVWFRDGCAREAQARGVDGWVRNLADGRVEAVFEGDAPAVDAIVEWCGHGPQRATVRAVEVVDELPIGATDVGGFAIR